MQIKTAIIILNYFGVDDTSACVQSCRENYPGSTVYLVDNSADVSERKKVEDIFRYAADVKLIFPPENLGFGAGVNLALREAVGDGFARFLVLNNDAILLEDAGAIFKKAFVEHPGSLIAPAIIWGDDICRGNYYHKYLGLITDKPLWESKSFLFYLSGCALAFDKTALDKIGYFDESFFMYGEDVEFTNRACERDVPVILLGDALVKHQGSKSAKVASFFYEYHLTRSHFLLSFRLCDSLPYSVIALLGKSIVMGARAVLRTVRYRNFSPLATLFLGPFPLRVRPRRVT